MYVKAEEFVGIIVELCALKEGLDNDLAKALSDRARQEVHDAITEAEK